MAPDLRVGRCTLAVAAAALAAMLAAAEPADARACVAEVEPNDQAGSEGIFAGAFCLAGAAEGRDRDRVAWTVDDAAAGQLWQLVLEGMPGQDGRLKIARVDAADDGSRETEILGEPIEPVAGVTAIPPVLLAAGRYAITVEGNHSGGLLYRLRAATGAALPGALPAAGVAGPFAGILLPPDEGRPTLAWTVDRAAAGRLWTLTLQGELGAAPALGLHNAAGRRVATADVRTGGIARLADLGLEPGTYEIRVGGRAGGRLLLSAVDSGARVAERAAEPDGDATHAVPFDPARPLSGRLIGSTSRYDDDVLLLGLDASRRDQRFDLVLRADSDAELALALLAENNTPIQERSAAREVRLPDLVLGPGDHLVRVRGELDPAASYTIAVEDRAPLPPAREREPNDTVATASSIEPDGATEARFAGHEWDVFALTVDGAPELWRIEAEGTAVERLVMYDGAGTVIANAPRSADAGRVRLSSLLLVGGRHLFGVQGSNGDYRLTATRLGPPPAPGASIEDVLARGLADELEPNDDPARAMRLQPGVPRSGALDRDGDIDLYRFHLAAESRVRITLSGPPGSSILADLQWGEVSREAPRLRAAGTGADRPQVVWDGLLGYGDHYLPVQAERRADGPYAVLFEHRPYFDRPVDLEPNDEWWRASALPADLRLAGVLYPQDQDWYRLPDLDRPATLVIRDLAAEAGTLAGATLHIVQETPPDPNDAWPSPQRTSVASLRRVPDAPEWRVELPAGEGYRLGIGGGDGAYVVGLDFGGVVEQRLAEALPVAMALELEAAEVAAFATHGQRVAGTLALRNQGTAPLELALLTHAGDERWQVRVPETRVALAAGAAARLPVTVEVTPDAWAGRPVVLAVAAQTEDGARAFAEATLTPTATAAVVGAHRAWPVPEPMLGGLDVAGAAVGGHVQVDEPRLIDGGVNQGTSATLTQSELRRALPVFQLAGDAPVPLAGVLLTPAALPEVGNRLRRFAISASLDGVAFEPVLEAAMTARPAEQAFPFPAPVQARFLRLEPIDTHGGERSSAGASLGELKAVAVPDSTPLDPRHAGLNLADPMRGGHVVWSAPLVDGWAMLSPEAERPRQNLPSGHEGPVQWVLGFARNRAAQVTAVEWLSPEGEADRQLVAVELAASLDSAVGPWTPLGQFPVPAGGTAATYRFPQPVWARYLRMTATPPDGARQVYLPETLVVHELPVGSGYRSALGEWGALGRDAVYEWIAPGPETSPPGGDNNDTRETADPLAFDVPVSGTVLLDSDVDWHRIDVPPDGHRILVVLSGAPGVEVVPTLFDARGAEVVLTPEDSRGRFAAEVSPGSYWLLIEDPPRSVALAWDTSGSVRAFVPAIVQAMRTFAEGLRPAREVVNLFPFRGEGTAALMADWSGDPLAVSLTLHAYPWTDASSDAEAALLAAAEALAERPGRRAIVLLTDAQSDGAKLTPKLWARLEATRPRIFPLAVPGSFTGKELWKTRNLMQDWAGLNGGFEQPMLSQGEIDVAFERAAGWLRRPAAYQLAVALDRTPPPPPEPAFLQVVAGDAPAAGGPPATGGILLILDASGSMLQRIDGVRRIEIARDTLTALTGSTIPPGTMLGLRVFGQGPPDSCDSELVLPPQPLDPADIAGVIAGVEPTNRARTPIGASLRAVADDLAAVTGSRLVVLITDGEETCGGDPEGEIAALRAMGIDVRVNIVGFALDDPALAATFSDWAALGGGRYFDAADAAALGAALTRAVRPNFTVEDSQGRTVATGIAGDSAIELAPGTYIVRIDGGGARRIVLGAGETAILSATF